MDEAAAEAVVEAVRREVRSRGTCGLELEWRLVMGNGHGRFVAGISRDAWETLRSHLSASRAFVPSTTATHETLGVVNGSKYVEYRVGEGVDAPAHWIVKHRVWDATSRPRPTSWFVRSSIAYESVPAKEPGAKTTWFRDKERWSFAHECWRVDLTRVQCNMPECVDDDCVYEVEIELADPDVLLVRPLENVVRWGQVVVGDVCRLTGFDKKNSGTDS